MSTCTAQCNSMSVAPGEGDGERWKRGWGEKENEGRTFWGKGAGWGQWEKGGGGGRGGGGGGLKACEHRSGQPVLRRVSTGQGSLPHGV